VTDPITLATESVGLSTDIIQITHHHSGNISPTAVLVPGATPRVVLSIPFDLAYTTFGLGMKKLTQLDLFLAKFVDFEKGGAGVHQKYSLASSPGAASAAAQITGWSVNADGIAMASVEIVPLSYDGKTHPLLISENQDLPTILGSPKLHTLGPAKFNGTIIPGVTSHSANIAGNLVVQRVDGDLYPKSAARLLIAPTLAIGHSDPKSVLTAMGLLGTDDTGSSSFFLKEYDETTGVTRDDGGAYQIDVDLGRFHPSGWDASTGAVVNNAITVQAIAPDGGTHPFAITADTVPPTP
jgi:hypothetical protein